MTRTGFTVEQAIEAQAASAEHIGSPLYAHLLEGLLTDLRMGGITAELLEGVSDQPVHDAVPLRYLAAGHRLALAGQARGLARYYPSCGGSWHGESIAHEFVAAARAHREEFEAALRRNVQTNEVGRAAVLASAFALIARRHRPQLDVLEIGSSAGLLSQWDHYFYDTGATSLGDSASELRFDRSWWRSPAPDLGSELQVVRRRASDIHPIDATTDAGRLTMLSFVWPDQPERIDRLRAALDIAARGPVPIDRADAGDWLAEQLGEGLRRNAATVVFHSIVWQYLPRATKNAVRAALEQAGAQASVDAPLLWLRMEPSTQAFADVRLTTWSGSTQQAGTEEVLAEVGYHGADINWLRRD